MIVSRGRGYVFVHVPKTGGTALALALEARALKDDILIGDTPKAVRRRPRLKGLTPGGAALEALDARRHRGGRWRARSWRGC